MAQPSLPCSCSTVETCSQEDFLGVQEPAVNSLNASSWVERELFYSENFFCFFNIWPHQPGRRILDP